MSLRPLLLVPACLLAFAAAAAAAATQLGGLDAFGLGAGEAVVDSCDHDGVRVDFAFEAMTVTGVVVDGLADDCVGSNLHVTVSAAGGQVQESATVVGAGPTLVDLPAPLDAADVTGISVVVNT